MQERVARPIGEFDEAKSLFGVEPLDDPADRWPGRGLKPGLAEPGAEEGDANGKTAHVAERHGDRRPAGHRARFPG